MQLESHKLNLEGQVRVHRVLSDGRGRPIASVYLAFPWWVSEGAQGTF